MNPTIHNFGYPQTLIKEYSHWVVLLRPKQVTLGSLVLACTEEAESWSTITPDAFSELAKVTDELETSLKELFGYDRINYLMLMMVDPNVHFHVIPRYSKTVYFRETDFPDSKWPGPPDLSCITEVSANLFEDLNRHLLSNWVVSK